jgi:hypothetical protein
MGYFTCVYHNVACLYAVPRCQGSSVVPVRLGHAAGGAVTEPGDIDQPAGEEGRACRVEQHRIDTDFGEDAMEVFSSLLRAGVR